jgi:c-di-GMP-binding flagellar brake protein YcgR
MNIEHRKFARYQIPSDTIFLYSNHSPIHGWVKDVSYGGMAFEYTLTDDCEIKPKIRLILAGESFPFYLSDIPCKVIHDIKISKNDRAVKGTETRRCGVQYEKLDTEMQEKLKFLLSSELMLPGM